MIYKSDSADHEFRKRTVGLVSAQEFRKAMLIVDETKTINKRIADEEENNKKNKKKGERDAKRKKMASSLSFGVDEENEELLTENKEINIEIIKKVSKDPCVYTAFLPDRDRDRIISETKEKLQKEWLEQQSIIIKDLQNTIL